ncbi:MarR family winged helix-turn-helix transcriptional regulator [Exiguobacterium acetylicum]|uniref:MarR family winged helix-turn-helix transcriptional regulator n=1 Tax=Exiguobacterium acetylicum TaxID=41170 RepID=UPI0030169605
MLYTQEDVLGQLSKVSRLVKREIDATLLPYSLHTGQWALIKAVALLQPVSQVQLADYLIIEKPAVTKTVSRLETLGFITRIKEGRTHFVSLTPLAIERFDQIDAAVQETHQRLLASFSLTDQQQLGEWMTHLLTLHRQGESS